MTTTRKAGVALKDVQNSPKRMAMTAIRLANDEATFKVESQSDVHVIYLATLNIHTTQGTCTCPDFEHRQKNDATASNKVPSLRNGFTCKHIKGVAENLGIS